MNIRSRLPISKMDLALVGVLLAVAAAVRLPYLNLVPVISDEAFEVLVALAVRQGQWVWFGPVNPTAGPLLTYLLALAFWLFGTPLYLPRAVIMVIGVLTVGATYFLGRSLGGHRAAPAAGRWAGAIAGLLLAFSPSHTIVNSHVAWSNSATPLFSTLAFTALHVALRERGAGQPRRRQGWFLVLAGLLYGLALQTHVSMIVVAPGLLIWFLARRDIGAWLRRPWPYLALGAAILGYGNMIAYNLMTRGGAVADFQTHTYAWVSEPTWATYWTNLKAMVGAVALTLGGRIPEPHDPLASVVMALLLAWLVAALLYALWRGETMPLWIILSALLIMPYFNQRYKGLLSQRYTAFLLPLGFAVMGLAAGHFLEWIRKQARGPRRALAICSVALILFLAVYPVRSTLAYYAREIQAGRDNRLSLTMADYLHDNLPADANLYLSSNLIGKRGDGGYRYLRAMYYWLTLKGVEHYVLDFSDLLARLEADPQQETWLLLTADDYQVLAQRFGLEPIANSPPVHNGGILARLAPRRSATEPPQP